MQLSREQIEQFERDGYLFFPSLFTPEEIRVLIDEVPHLYAQHRPENVREKGSDAVRTNFAAHMYSKPFARLARHPRMVEPVMQIFGEPVYMHQFKINGKMAFEGDLWQWHQDYGTWQADDLMPEARAMNVAIFLDEVNEFNGPLMFIPGSHELGVLDAAHDVTHHQLSAVDHQPRHHPPAGRARRPGGAQRPARVTDHVSLVPGTRLDGQPLPLEPGERLLEPVCGVEPYPPLQATGVHRASGLHADPVPPRRLPAQGLRRALALAGWHAGGGITTRAR